MTLKDVLTGKVGSNSMDRKVFSLLATFLVVIGLFIVAGILFPAAVSTILNIFWIVLLTSAVIFFTLGILVIIGMRREAMRILDILLEGSLTFIDFLDFIRAAWQRFVQLVKEFLIFAAPIFAYIFAFMVYALLLIIYKTVGKTYDVTLLTIGITITALVIFGIVSRPTKESLEEPKWSDLFRKRFKAGFIDGFEVVLFIFFLTMDSTKLFFLPADLNVELHARIADYNLMTRSFVYDPQIRITLALIVIVVTIEIIRNIIRIFVLARKYYLQKVQEVTYDERYGTLALLKESIRHSFNNAKDDLIKFVTFNTVLFAVFLLFPRLKLFTLALTSCTNLLLDLFIRSRLTTPKGNDLISRGIAKIFRL